MGDFSNLLLKCASFIRGSGKYNGDGTVRDDYCSVCSVPTCVFTYPEVAFVEDLVGRPGEFPLRAGAKAQCIGDTRGFVKVFEMKGALVGCYIIGPHAGEIIGEAVLAIKMNWVLRTYLTRSMHILPSQNHLQNLLDLSTEDLFMFQKEGQDQTRKLTGDV